MIFTLNNKVINICPSLCLIIMIAEGYISVFYFQFMKLKKVESNGVVLKTHVHS